MTEIHGHQEDTSKIMSLFAATNVIVTVNWVVLCNTAGIILPCNSLFQLKYSTVDDLLYS